MAKATKANAVVGQSGGPTGVINASLVGVIEEAKTCHPASGFSFRFEIRGKRQQIQVTASGIRLPHEGNPFAVR